MRHTIGLTIAIALAGQGSLRAQSPVCNPAGVTADPSVIDTVYPPAMRVVRIPSGGVYLNGVLYLAQGPGRHPTVIFLHGFPGDEKNLDLAQAVRRAGLNALAFHYRGAWGSPGAYSFSHMLEDVAAALAWLRDSTIADSTRLDRSRLILVGHSLGGFAALYTAAVDDRVAAVAALAPVDPGMRGAALRDSTVLARVTQALGTQLGALRGTSGDELSRELLTHADEWSLQRKAQVLAKRTVLLLAASHDEAVPPSEVSQLRASLRAAGAGKLTTLTFRSDHAFSGVRIGLAQSLVRWLCEST